VRRSREVRSRSQANIAFPSLPLLSDLFIGDLIFADQARRRIPDAPSAAETRRCRRSRRALRIPAEALTPDLIDVLMERMEASSI
jgi:hypothetical protein